MKKVLFVTICAMAVMISCKQSNQKVSADSAESEAAVADGIIEENDTTPLPMFLIGGDSKYMHMLYWTKVEEPVKQGEDDEWFEQMHKRWELQEMFRRNAAQYTNRIVDGKMMKVKFVDEVLKNPDGDTPSYGEIHMREEIPSLCARFDFVNSKDNDPGDPEWGTVIVTDSYLKTRKRLDISVLGDDGSYPALSADIVKQLEKEYGMKTLRSSACETIGKRYTHGVVEFAGEYKNASKDLNDEDRKFALALELIIDGDKIYKMEELGYYDPEYGSVWNADADGYISNNIVAAFEGPKGLELCYTHNAPESFCVGMIYLWNGELIEQEYEMFHCLVDEEIPIWKKDFAEMDKLYHADEMGEDDVELTKWAHCFIDYENDWIWLRDNDDKNGAFFIRKDDKYQLIAIENPRLRPSRCEKDGVFYLKFEGPAGGSSWQHEIHAFKGGERIWKLNVLKVEGEICEAGLNDKDISNEEAKAYLDMVPEGKEITAWFKNVNGDIED